MSTLSVFRYDRTVQNVVGQAIPGAEIAVLSQPADTTTQPGSPLVDLYAASVSNQAIAITTATWSNGKITFQFAAPPPADVVVGAYIKAKGFTPGGYNGVWQIDSINGNLVTVTIPYTPTVAIVNPGTVSVVGTINTSALPNPLQSDTLGNFFFYAVSGFYTVQIYSPLLADQLVFADQAVVGSGGGSVTSVALTMPAEFAVAGSPIVVAGTLAVTKANQNANIVYAGPATGAPAAPTFRSLVAADFPAGVGTVTSIGLTIAVPAFMGQSVIGSPVTTNGTLAVTLTFNNQTANTFLAGPTSGGAAAPSFRALDAADVPAGTAFGIQQNPPATPQTIGSGSSGVALQDLTFTIPAGTWNILIFGSAQFENSATNFDVNISVNNFPVTKGSAHGTTPSAGTGQAIALSFCGLDLAVAGGVSKTYHLVAGNNGASSVDVTWATLNVVLVRA